jgi:hypothetical protein
VKLIASLLTITLRLNKGGGVKINEGEIIETTLDNDHSFTVSKP